MQLRPYQLKGKTDIYDAWNKGVKNVLYVAPTGSGKTVTFSEVLKEHDGASCANAHRQELVSQISLALARDEVRHTIIAPKNVITNIVNIHMMELGRSFYHSNSHCAVAGVDTLGHRKNELASWGRKVTKWVQDEAHHLLKENKWGKAASMFPNAIGLGVTATPIRADGKGLGRHSDGLFDTLIESVGMRELINEGYLTDYRIFAPRTEDLYLEDVDTGADGDYKRLQLKKAVRRSHIVGDVVKHYLRIAPGKIGVTFASDVETARDITAQYNAAGVPAALVTAETPDIERMAISRKVIRREILQLVNVDMFGEGYDLPAIEVVSMARPTKSFALYVQQFGRALRLLEGKLYAIIIDHVGNVDFHKLPDRSRIWTLDARDRRSRNKDNGIPVTVCLNPMCTAVYERIYNKCPYCGHKPTPGVGTRSSPKQVDGDLLEIDAQTLANMRGEILHVDRPVADVGVEMQNKYAPRVAVLTAMKRHEQMQEMQEALRASIAWWAGYQKDRGLNLSESYRLFYFTFGIDVMTAQTLKRTDALSLAMRVNQQLGEMNYG